MRKRQESVGRRGRSKGLVALLAMVPVLALVAPASAGTDDKPSAQPQFLGIGKSDVRVINTPAEPVPVAVTGTPTVAVSGTPTVALAGTPTVAVAGTVPVAVAGTVPVAPAFPTDRFDSAASLDVGEGSGNTCSNCDDQVMLDVPDGKIAVIDHVSMHMTSTPGAVFNVTLITRGGLHFIESEYLDTDAFDRRNYVGSHAITLAATPLPGADDEVVVQALSLGGLFPPYRMSAHVRISGYFVDAPA